MTKLSEQEALKSAYFSYYYAFDVLKGRFEKGENTISKDAKYSKSYRKNIYDAEKELEKKQKEKEQKELEAIKKSINVNCLYGIEV